MPRARRVARAVRQLNEVAREVGAAREALGGASRRGGRRRRGSRDVERTRAGRPPLRPNGADLVTRRSRRTPVQDAGPRPDDGLAGGCHVGGGGDERGKDVGGGGAGRARAHRKTLDIKGRPSCLAGPASVQPPRVRCGCARVPTHTPFGASLTRMRIRRPFRKSAGRGGWEEVSTCPRQRRLRY